MDIIVRKRNIRVEVNEIRHSINMFEEYLLIQENNPLSIEVIRTMRDINYRCNRLRLLLSELGMDFDISELPDIQQNVVTHISDIGYVRMRINRIRYMTCNIEFCLLNDRPHIINDNNIRKIITFVQVISMICQELITLMIMPQPPQPPQQMPPQPPPQMPPLPPAQGGKKGKKNNKTKNRKITRKKTQKKH